MGLNRMMMKNGEVNVANGSKFWDYTEADNKTISFTVPPNIKRIKVEAMIRFAPGSTDGFYSSIKNKMTNKKWGEWWLGSGYEDIIVGVTPNKTYELLFNCYYTNGVTFLWGKAINDMTPTVKDY